MNKKRFGKMMLILGIALLFSGIGLGIYSTMFANVYYFQSPPNMVPSWYANVIAATFAFLGIALIALGASELRPAWVDRWLNNS